MKKKYVRPEMKAAFAVGVRLCAGSNGWLRVEEVSTDKVQVDFRVDWNNIPEGDAGTAMAKGASLWDEPKD